MYKRALDQQQSLKLKASRTVLAEINRRFPALPFPARALEDIRGANMGLVDCMRHELLHEYPVLYEKEGALVAHMKATVLVMPSGVDRITSNPPRKVALKPTCELKDEEALQLLEEPPKTKKKKGSK